MKLAFERLDGPYGIPVYFQPIPDVIEVVHLKLVMYVGAADDYYLKAPGLHHWFEHVPFRGSKQYPNGYADTKGQFIRDAGKNGAVTNRFSTCHWANIPKRRFGDALRLICDLVGQPLVTDEGITAERTVIAQEIAECKSKAGEFSRYYLHSLLWNNHPYSHHVLGSEADLAQVDPARLRFAWETGYDRSRAVLIVSGSVDPAELIAQFERFAPALPDHKLPERRTLHSHGKLPLDCWQGGTTTTIETSFSGSVVLMLWPLESATIARSRGADLALAGQMYEMGGLTSPLYAVLREERKLIYGVGVTSFVTPDGGYIGFCAETKRENIPKVIQSFKDVVVDPRARSAERLEEVRHNLRSGIEMRLINPRQFAAGALGLLNTYGYVPSDDELLSRQDAVSHEQIIEIMDSLTEDRARTIVFEGRGKD